jgi:hypothetical protein
LILATFDCPDDGFLNHLVGDYHNLFKKQTVLEYLTDHICQIKHKRGAERDAAFVKELSERFMESNNQMRTDKTFLIVSDRLGDLQGKFHVVGQRTDFSHLDFTPYAAIVVDNNYSFKDNSSKLGSGITVLERLSSLDVNLPIIYQTAHSLDELTEEDIQQLRQFPNVTLFPKNLAFKICTPRQARKEVTVTELLKQDRLLSTYCVHAFPITSASGQIANDYALVATEAISRIENPPLLTGTFNLPNNAYSHRMAVLAAFHTQMKKERDNPLFLPTVAYLRPWKIVKRRLREAGCLSFDTHITKQLYCALKEKHERYPSTTLIHHDPKWDNWFGGYVLGDFADCGPGREEKDIARALFDKETGFQNVRDIPWINARIEEYMRVRGILDPAFTQGMEYVTAVHELIFLESLRIAGFLAQGEGDENIIRSLLSVAQHYQDVLSDL